MNISQRTKAIFMGNAPFTVSLMGLIIAALLCPIYLSGNFNGLNHYVHDRLYLLRLAGPKPHPDIVLITITNSTVTELGWPMPRQHYIKLLEKLSSQKAKAIGFNILLGTPSKSDPATDLQLAEQVGKTTNLVMPFFYNYAEGTNLSPLPILKEKVTTLGNVSAYPGEVSRFIQAEILNQDASPREVLFPMGVELARMYLDLPHQSISIGQNRLKLANKAQLYLEDAENGSDLIRIHYQGAPDFFPKVALEDVLNNRETVSFKDKLVLLGAFTPTLGDIATSPYGDQTSLPMYGTELQAHIAQSVLNHNALFHIPATWIIFALLLMGFSSGVVLTRFTLWRQMLILLTLTLTILVTTWLAFNFFASILDPAPFILFFALMAVGQAVVLNLRSYVAINDQIIQLQEYEQKLPEVPAGRRLENILTSFYYISQADWVGFRRLDSEKRLMQLHDVKSRMTEAKDDEDPVPVYPFSSLPPYYPVEPVSKISAGRVIPLEYQQLPPEIKEAYASLKSGYFVLMPIYAEHKHLIGMFELYYANISGADEIQASLLEDLRDVAAESLFKFNQQDKPSRDLVSGVEQKIQAMNRLVLMREVETAFFSTVLESTTNPVVVCDQIGEIRFYNDNFLQLLHLQTHADITAGNIQELMSRVFQIMPQQWQEIWMTTLQRRKLKEVQVNTEYGVYHLTLTPVFGRQSEVTGVVIILTDVTKLHRQANYDKLTGLYNRRYFDELIMKEFQRCQRNPSQPFSLLMMDVDHFKKFNDTYGHQVGDQVLASFGQVLSKVVRRTDMPIRYGGEEMAVILPNTFADNAAIVAEKIRRSIESLQLYDLEGKPIKKITTSIGVTEFDPRDAKPDDMMRRADDALYKCKDAGRNCIHIHRGEKGIAPYGKAGSKSSVQ